MRFLSSISSPPGGASFNTIKDGTFSSLPEKQTMKVYIHRKVS